ncbi:T9SS type A sorting domain-containing protein [Mucilaginibacter mali]|uniref:T9SS type A sorting domain-containing protein n=1 Tax=Mucilaginibacter mali TaxID=2740462 RepID=A0A7D4QLH8_9SPHI|nr:T9SS type A sorting domain-containing protein [Mucilaginibacter mali]QKJ31290.1 T9SS type A sorting domain-containing protein [Mucilaginibacter mali]
MKALIKSSAIVAVLALLSSAVFAAENPTKKAEPAAAKKDVVVFTALAQDKGVGVIIHKADVSKTSVAIYDAEGNVVMKDIQAKNGNDVLKGYVLSALENGKYTIKVTSNNEVTKRVVNVYNDENNQKAFLFEL